MSAGEYVGERICGECAYNKLRDEPAECVANIGPSCTLVCTFHPPTITVLGIKARVGPVPTRAGWHCSHFQPGV